MKKIFLRNKLVPASQAKVPVLDRGFLYGDGVYEAVRIYQGKIFRAEEHWRRLGQSLRAVHMKIPWSHGYLTQACLKTARANALPEALARVTISRGVGDLGYDPSTCGRPTLTVIAAEVRPDLPQLWERGVKAALVSIRRNHVLSLNPAIKHTNALNGILAKIESLRAGAFEGVLLNLEGYVTEGTISNIFMVRRGVLRTPALGSGILDGVTRHAVLETARRSGIKVREDFIRKKELLAADEIFLTSTTMEVMPVVNIDGRKVGPGTPGPVTRLLQKRFRGLVAKELNVDV